MDARAPAEAGAGAGQSPQPLTPVRFLHSLSHPPTSKLNMGRLQLLCLRSSSSLRQPPSLVGLAGLPCARQRQDHLPGGRFPALSLCLQVLGSAPTSLISAWNSGASKKVAHPAPGSQSTSGASQPPGKSGKGGKGGQKVGPLPAEEERAVQSPLPTGAAERAHDGLPAGRLPPRPLPRSARRRRWAPRSLAPLSPHPGQRGPLGPRAPPTAAPAEGPAMAIVTMDTQRGRPRSSTLRSPLGSQGPHPRPTPRKTSSASVAPAHPGCPHLQVGVLGRRPATGPWEGAAVGRMRLRVAQAAEAAGPSQAS